MITNKKNNFFFTNNFLRGTSFMLNDSLDVLQYFPLKICMFQKLKDEARMCSSTHYITKCRCLQQTILDRHWKKYQNNGHPLPSQCINSKTTAVAELLIGNF